MGIKSWLSDFRRGLSTIFGRPTEGEGDRKLAKVSLIVEGQIDTYGKHAVRKQVIKSIENDMKRAAKKGQSTVDALMQNALQTPEYTHLLHRLGLEESHIMIAAMEAMKNENRTHR